MCTNLSEELSELLPLRILGGDGQPGLLQCLTKETADFLPGGAESLSLRILG